MRPVGPPGPPAVWLPSLAFVALAVVAHALEPELLRHPLSFARDGRHPVVGYSAFGSLILAITCYGVVYLRAWPHLRKFAVGPLAAAGLLLVVAVTPTRSTFHDVIAGTMLVWVTVFFAVRMLDVSPWLAGGFLAGVVVTAGVVLVFSPPWSQKLLILIQVVTMNVDARRVRRAT